MKFSNKTRFSLLALLITLNIILRLQVVPHEIGNDTFIIHIMTNSISEFGYAKWVLSPLSLIGYYPLSEASSVQFFVSGMFQTVGMEMEPTIFMYALLLGILSGLTAYVFAGAILNDDFFKFLAAFGLSTSGSLLDLTTWTMGMRGLLVVIAPLIGYLLLRVRLSLKYILPMFILAFLLLSTHRSFVYLIPMFISFILTITIFNMKNHIPLKFPMKFVPIFAIAGFFAMFSIPFVFHIFIESSKYDPFFKSYVRYIGIFTIFVISGIIYLIFKYNKSFEEWFLLLTIMFFTAFIYQQTYFKYFIVIFAAPVACIGLINIVKLTNKRKIALIVISIALIASVSFSGYYQFLHEYRKQLTEERYIEESTFNTGRWMKEYADGIGISNDMYYGMRIFATSENVHHVTPFYILDNIYGFLEFNVSEFSINPITSEEFWYNIGKPTKDLGENLWFNINTMDKNYRISDISYFVESVNANGNIIWHHLITPSKLSQLASEEKNLIYSNGNFRLWKLN